MHMAININTVCLVKLPPDVSFLNTIHTKTVFIIFKLRISFWATTARAASKVAIKPVLHFHPII